MVMVMNGKAMETIKAELIDLIGKQQAAELSEWLGTYIEREVLSVADDPKKTDKPKETEDDPARSTESSNRTADASAKPLSSRLGEEPLPTGRGEPRTRPTDGARHD